MLSNSHTKNVKKIGFFFLFAPVRLLCYFQIFFLVKTPDAKKRNLKKPKCWCLLIFFFFFFAMKKMPPVFSCICLCWIHLLFYFHISKSRSCTTDACVCVCLFNVTWWPVAGRGHLGRSFIFPCEKKTNRICCFCLSKVKKKLINKLNIWRCSTSSTGQFSCLVFVASTKHGLKTGDSSDFLFSIRLGWHTCVPYITAGSSSAPSAVCCCWFSVITAEV